MVYEASWTGNNSGNSFRQNNLYFTVTCIGTFLVHYGICKFPGCDVYTCTSQFSRDFRSMRFAVRGYWERNTCHSELPCRSLSRMNNVGLSDMEWGWSALHGQTLWRTVKMRSSCCSFVHQSARLMPPTLENVSTSCCQTLQREICVVRFLYILQIFGYLGYLLL